MQELKIVDFGIACTNTELIETNISVIPHTPGFSPPEQCFNIGKTGAATDFYAFGAVIYSVLTKEIPLAVEERQKSDNVKPLKCIISDFNDFANIFCSVLTKKMPQVVEELKETVKTDNKQILISEIGSAVSLLIDKCLNLNYVERPQSIEDIFDILKGKREETISITTIFPAEKIDIKKDINNELSKYVSTVTEPKKPEKSFVKSRFKWKQFFLFILFSVCFMTSMIIFKFIYSYDNICSRSCALIKIKIIEIAKYEKSIVECAPCLVDKLIDIENREKFHEKRLYCPKKNIIYFIYITEQKKILTSVDKNATLVSNENKYTLKPAYDLKAHEDPSVSTFIITCE